MVSIWSWKIHSAAILRHSTIPYPCIAIARLSYEKAIWVNTLKSRIMSSFQTNFLHTFFNVNCCVLMKTSPNFVRSGPIDYNPLCGQIIGWDSSRWRANIRTNDGLVHPPSVPGIFEMVPVVALALVLPVRQLLRYRLHTLTTSLSRKGWPLSVPLLPSNAH